MEDKEILRRILQGFKLIPAKFPLTYTTIAGKATPDLAKRINAWIQTNFPNSLIRVAFDATHGILKFYRRMQEQLVVECLIRNRLRELLEADPNKTKRISKDRLVYAWEFPDQGLAYIGLTGDEKKRLRSHTSSKAQKTTAVSRFIRETGTTWTREDNYKVLSATEENPSGYVPEKEAGDLECKYMAEYRANGWTLLNLAPCGSLGGSVHDEKEVITSVDNFIKSNDTSVNAGKLLSGSDYVKNYIALYNKRDLVFNRLKDIITKNNITSNKQLRALEHTDNKRRLSKLIEDWSRLYRDSDNWQAMLYPNTTNTKKLPKQGVEAFIAEPDNLDKDQLNLITKRAFKQIQPNEEKTFLIKVKKIIDKYNIDKQSRNKETRLPSGLYQSINSHDNEHPDNKWMDILYPKQSSKKV